mmetsp:Transcript_8832/g.22886  ORF Transcript_8832/g.22886 Transcript_8832/m.22886 type:complete len:244 (+) Transcript_8832:195-926(+)
MIRPEWRSRQVPTPSSEHAQSLGKAEAAAQVCSLPRCRPSAATTAATLGAALAALRSRLVVASERENDHSGHDIVPVLHEEGLGRLLLAALAILAPRRTSGARGLARGRPRGTPHGKGAISRKAQLQPRVERHRGRQLRRQRLARCRARRRCGRALRGVAEGDDMADCVELHDEALGEGGSRERACRDGCNHASRVRVGQVRGQPHRVGVACAHELAEALHRCAVKACAADVRTWAAGPVAKG